MIRISVPDFPDTMKVSRDCGLVGPGFRLDQVHWMNARRIPKRREGNVP